MVLSCRLCLTEDPEEELKNVFQCNVKHAEDSLVDVLFWVFSVEIDVTDPFSKHICSDCIQLIEYILQVKNTFQKNQEGLKNLLQNPNHGSLGVQALDDNGIGVSYPKEKVCINGQKSSSTTTPTSSPTRSRYNSKSVYGSCSPRVRVSLSTLETMCPLDVDLVPFENTQEYLRYKQLKNGSFKKRKYRHFNLDESLLDDICSSLEDKKCIKTEPLKKEVGVLTEHFQISKAVNTDEMSLCMCYKNLTSPLSASLIPVKDVLNTDKTQKDSEHMLDNDDDLLDLIGLTKNVTSRILSPEVDREYDWTKLTFKKDASTNTESAILPTRDIGINAVVHSVTTGTLTKHFKQMKQKNVVKVNIDLLESFGPQVVLEPLKNILEEENYKQIDKFSYIKRDDSSSQSESDEDSSEENEESNEDYDQQHGALSKKQKFLDYYKNFSSFAVRELIAGKKIRESDSETSPVLKITNVCSVFVCNFCSKSFLSQMRLNMHYSRAHDRTNKSSDADLEGSVATTLPEQIKKRQGRPPGMPSVKKINTVNKTSIKYTKDKSTARKLTGLRRIAHKVNYSLKDIKIQKTRFRQMPVQIKKMRRRKKIKPLVSDDTNNISYAWDRKRLGKYSAISYYKNYTSDEKGPLSDLSHCDIRHKEDLSLNDTIQKLADRLEGSCNSDVNRSES